MGFDFKARLKDAKLSEKGDPLEDGTYEVEVQRMTFVVSRKKQHLIFVEMKVLESTNPKHPANCVRSWCVNMDLDMAGANILAFMCACLGRDPKASETKAWVEDESAEGFGTEAQAEALEAGLDDPTNPKSVNGFKGTRLGVDVKTIITKEKKQPFGLHTWRPGRKAA